MSLYLNTNTASISGQRHLSNITLNLNKSLARLSSGYKINNASDGPAGLVASELLRGQIRGSQAAINNVQQGISMTNAAGGVQQSSMDVLQRMREIAVEASNGTVTNFTPYVNEFTQLQAQLDANAATTYNGTDISDAAAAVTLHVGPNAANTLNISAAFGDIQATALAVDAGNANVASNAGAQAAVTSIDAAINTLGGIMATTGGMTNRLQGIANNLSITVENLSASEASIRNTDVAQETATLTRLQIMQQAAAASLAQANQMPAIALTLLG